MFDSEDEKQAAVKAAFKKRIADALNQVFKDIAPTIQAAVAVAIEKACIIGGDIAIERMKSLGKKPK